MLESSSLLINPWTPVTDAAGRERWQRTIADADSGAGVGCVRWSGPRRRAWLSWLGGQRLKVLETEDAALLMTIARHWGPFRLWDVYDAEERRVGSIYPPVLLDAEGCRRGYVESESASAGKLLGPDAQPLAEFAETEDGRTLLTFGAEQNPFLRMLLLAGVLVLDPEPS